MYFLLEENRKVLLVITSLFFLLLKRCHPQLREAFLKDSVVWRCPHPAVREGEVGQGEEQRLPWPIPWEARIQLWGHGCPGREVLPAPTVTCIRETRPLSPQQEMRLLPRRKAWLGADAQFVGGGPGAGCRWQGPVSMAFGRGEWQDLGILDSISDSFSKSEPQKGPCSYRNWWFCSLRLTFLLH